MQYCMLSFFKEICVMKWERNVEGHIIFSTTWKKYMLFKNVEFENGNKKYEMPVVCVGGV